MYIYIYVYISISIYISVILIIYDAKFSYPTNLVSNKLLLVSAKLDSASAQYRRCPSAARMMGSLRHSGVRCCRPAIGVREIIPGVRKDLVAVRKHPLGVRKHLPRVLIYINIIYLMYIYKHTAPRWHQRTTAPKALKNNKKYFLKKCPKVNRCF